MTRQVRLDEDVVAFVEAVSEGLSLSATANRLLRQLAQDPPPSPDARGQFGQPEGGGSTRPSKPLGTASGAMMPPAGARAFRPTPGRRARQLTPRCPHPLARRFGETCVACGRVVRS